MSLTVHLYCLGLDPKLWGPEWLEGSASPIHFISLFPGGLWVTPRAFQPQTRRTVSYPHREQASSLLYHQARVAEKTGKWIRRAMDMGILYLVDVLFVLGEGCFVFSDRFSCTLV